jgi:transposase
MSNQERRRWSSMEKMAIVEEARSGGLSVGEVCRRHQIAPQVFYDWDRKIREGSLEALSPKPRTVGKSKQPTRSLSEAEAEIARLKEMIVTIAQENLQIKKGFWP